MSYAHGQPGIYRIRNTANGRFYIGSTQNLPKRRQAHLRDLEMRRHDNQRMQASYNKHGKDKFVFEVLILCETTDLLFYEQRFLDTYWDNGVLCFNILPKAASTVGFRPSAESRAKMSASHKGRKQTEAHRRAKSEALRGNTNGRGNAGRKPQPVTEETRRKLSEAGKRRHKGPHPGFSNETLRRMSEVKRGKVVPPETREKIAEKMKTLWAIRKGAA